jgi:hypothetical protein
VTGRPAPTTLAWTGSAATAALTGAAAISVAFTFITFCATGRALMNVSRETTVTPLVTRWFA